MDPKQTFMQFVAAINGHNIPALTALMPPGHTFIDSAGNRTEGAAAMEVAWRGYFAMCPDYWIRPDTIVSEANIVLAEGQAGGSIRGIMWQTPAAWKAVILEGKVAEWRVFADNKPVYEILARDALRGA